MQDLIALWASAVCVGAALLFYGLSLRANTPTDKTAFRIQLVYFSFYFVAAPLLHIAFNVFVELPVSSKEISLAWLNVIHAVGLTAASMGAVVASRRKTVIQPAHSQVNWRGVRTASILGAIAGGLTFLWLWQTYGAALLVDRSEVDSQNSASIFTYMLVESVPLLCGWAYIAHTKINPKKRGALSFFVALLSISLVAVVFSGTRGSRVAVIFQIVAFLLLYHKLVSNIRMRQVFVFIVMFGVFNNFYAIYKYDGMNAVLEYMSTGEKPDVVEKYSGTGQVLLQDLGRSDVAAVVFDRVRSDEYVAPNFPHTYLAGVQLLLPQPLRSEALLPKTVLGASAQYSVPAEKNFSSTRIYGPAAEAALNFGLWFVVPVFFLLGYVHKFCLNAALTSQSGTKVLFYPLFVLFPIFMVFYDFDNIVFSIVKSWAIPLIVYLNAAVSVTKIRQHASV